MIPLPALRRIRRVLMFVDITQVRRLMEEQVSDAMTVTSCTNLPDLRDSEDMAMFTYARLLKPGQIQTTTVGDLLAGISQYIDNTWGVNIDADTMDLVGVIEQAAPSLCAILTPSVVFYKRIALTGLRHKTLASSGSSSAVSYHSLVQLSRISMRMSCHKAPPPNYLP